MDHRLGEDPQSTVLHRLQNLVAVAVAVVVVDDDVVVVIEG